jgi:hypothetical protein
VHQRLLLLRNRDDYALGILLRLQLCVAHCGRVLEVPQWKGWKGKPSLRDFDWQLLSNLTVGHPDQAVLQCERGVAKP